MSTVARAVPATGLVWAERGDTGRLWVLGPDRVEFLHGQSSNDVKSLRAGAGHATTFLTGKGKMRGDGVLYALADRFLLVTEPGVAAGVRKHLETYIVTEDVQVGEADSDIVPFELRGESVFAVVGEILGIGTAGELPQHHFLTADFAGGCVRVAREANGVRLLADAVVGPALRLALAARAVESDSQAVEIARIESGRPRFGVDTDDDTIPIEAGLLDAISYSKGCYTGNEVLARIKTYGHVNRHLRGLRVAGDEIPLRGDAVRHDGRVVGAVTSACFSPTLGSAIALGMIRHEAAAPGTRVEVEHAGRTLSAAVVETPFIPHASETSGGAP